MGENLAGSKTSELMNELYNDETASTTQGKIQAETTAGNILALTGVAGVVKTGVKKGIKAGAEAVKDKNKKDGDNTHTDSDGSGEADAVPETEYDSKGNVISRDPKTMQDELVMESIKKGDAKGEVIISSDKINDTRYPNHDKMEYTVTSKDGKKTTVHYMVDKKTGEISDTKFMNHGKDGNTEKLGDYEKQPREQGGIVDPKAKEHNKNLKVPTRPNKASVQAELDRLPDGQGSNYHVRDNGNGTYSAIRNDSTNTTPIKVTEEGNLYSPDAVKSTHGNTLNDNPAECYGLHCRDTGDVKKYGETTHGEDKYGAGKQQRYSDYYLKENNVEYEQIETGTKQDMHQLQHQLIKDYKANNDGKRPDLNLNDY